LLHANFRGSIEMSIPSHLTIWDCVRKSLEETQKHCNRNDVVK
jgi:hypothetical protein